MAPPLIALNARAVIAGPHGERTLPLDEFFTGVGVSALGPGEILIGLLVPRLERPNQASYLKLEHRAAMDISIVGVGVCVKNNTDHVRIVLGAVAPTPVRARQAEALLRGSPLTPERIAEAARVAATEAQPIDDVRGSAWYRREMIEVLTRRQLLEMQNDA